MKKKANFGRLLFLSKASIMVTPSMKFFLFFLLVIFTVSAAPVCKDPKELKRLLREKKMGLYYKQLGDCYAFEDETQNAIRAYRKALSYRQDLLPLSFRLEILDYLGEQGLQEEAIAGLKRLLEEDPYNKEAERLFVKFSKKS